MHGIDRQGNNGTVSETVFFGKTTSQNEAKATAMWSTSSSCCDDDDVNDEAEGTKDANSRKRRKARGRNMLRGEVFYDNAYYHIRILGSRD